jgi:hypothetical protein
MDIDFADDSKELKFIKRVLKNHGHDEDEYYTIKQSAMDEVESQYFLTQQQLPGDRVYLHELFREFTILVKQLLQHDLYDDE